MSGLEVRFGNSILYEVQNQLSDGCKILFKSLTPGESYLNIASSDKYTVSRFEHRILPGSTHKSEKPMGDELKSKINK